jgi:hypothetical protein
MGSLKLVLSAFITTAVAFGVFLIVRYIHDSQLSSADLVSAAVVGLATGVTTLLLFKKYR